MDPGMRWLSVSPPDQPELEIILMPVADGMMFRDDCTEQMKALVYSGTFGFGVFECNNVQATYERTQVKRRGL